ncbi:hypothetical protein OE699_02095 [Sedimentimonas flavescens]|uniref:Uncharacterized protein n=1 Tax=Sedimentimonas flavescens TaxID=2851012 RepID=A0ABT2ZV63_9RHOB|nr:hypothetical protein [Sedimentimonas flavescens]MCV2877631.1 hypothetical protein [Sedimentimonas flavescens]
MNDIAADLTTMIGLVFTLLGAGITAYAVILKEDDAILIGVSRYASESREENLNLPMVRNLLWSSWAARVGLISVCFGTFLQLIPIFLRLAQ